MITGRAHREEGMMFGSLFKLQPKAGKKDELIRQMMDEGDDRSIKGFRASYVIDTQGGELWALAVFDDEKAYRANANDPEQDKWYRRMRDLLEADPEWKDATIHVYEPGR
jgi:hypothetical protein